MTAYICNACGTQYPDSEAPPRACPICEDERQFIPSEGQTWTTACGLSAVHDIAWRREDPGVFSLAITPHFAIGQRAFLIETDAGNVLWDCLCLVDESAVEKIRARGGLHAIAISHPHYYSMMGAWSAALGDVPIYLHEDDRMWVQKPSPAIKFWSGDRLELTSSLTLVRCGGHFAGGTVMHWSDGPDAGGSLFSGDIVQVSPDRKHASFMYSYPNLIPLDAGQVGRIADRLAPFEFGRVYGAFAGRTIAADGKAAIARSAERYLEAISKSRS